MTLFNFDWPTWLRIVADVLVLIATGLSGHAIGWSRRDRFTRKGVR